MATKRTPIARAGRRRITADAVEAYRLSELHREQYRGCAPSSCKSSSDGEHCAECAAYLDARVTLQRTLGLRPWETLEEMPELLAGLQAAA
jgi:hypothetical protein